MKRLLILLFLFYLFSPILLSAQQAWTRINATPQENNINDMCLIPGTNTIIAACNGSTLMKSDDGGLCWSLSLYPANLYNEYNLTCVYFINNNLGFIGTNDRIILRTTDSGNTWDTCQFNHTGLSKMVQDIGSLNDTTIYAICDFGKLYKSTNAGITWHEDFQLSAHNCLKIQTLNDSSGFISCASPNSFLKTINGGQTWSETTSFGLPSDFISDFFFVTDSIGTACMSESTRFFKTTDAGNTWTEVYSDWRAAYWKIAFFDEMNGIATGYTFFGYYDILLLTDDGGSTWHEKTSNTNREDFCISILDENTCIKAGYLGMMHKSTDKGLNWTQLNHRTIWGKIVNVQMLDNETGFAVSEIPYGGIAGILISKTVDGGQNWTLIKHSSSSNALLSFINIDTGYLATNEPFYGIYKTTNGGVSWTTVTVNGLNFIPDAIAFNSYYNGLIADASKLYKTSDAGNNWTEIPTGLSANCFIRTVYYYNSDVIFITATKQSLTYFLKSYNRGQSWEVIEVGEFGNVLPNYLSNEIIYFLSGTKLLKSFDSGNTWNTTIINPPCFINFNSMNFITQDTGFLAGNGAYCNIIKTTDGGNTWTVSNSAVTSGLTAIKFFDCNNGLAFGENGVIIKTTTGGLVNTVSFPEQNQKLEVFPNPFSNRITVDLSGIKLPNNSSLGLYDLYGKCLYSSSVNSTSERFVVNLEWLPQGIYMLKLTTTDPNFIRTCKIVKL